MALGQDQVAQAFDELRGGDAAQHFEIDEVVRGPGPGAREAPAQTYGGPRYHPTSASRTPRVTGRMRCQVSPRKNTIAPGFLSLNVARRCSSRGEPISRSSSPPS